VFVVVDDAVGVIDDVVIDVAGSSTIKLIIEAEFWLSSSGVIVVVVATGMVALEPVLSRIIMGLSSIKGDCGGVECVSRTVLWSLPLRRGVRADDEDEESCVVAGGGDGSGDGNCAVVDRVLVESDLLSSTFFSTVEAATIATPSRRSIRPSTSELIVFAIDLSLLYRLSFARFFFLSSSSLCRRSSFNNLS